MLRLRFAQLETSVLNRLSQALLFVTSPVCFLFVPEQTAPQIDYSESHMMWQIFYSHLSLKN